MTSGGFGALSSRIILYRMSNTPAGKKTLLNLWYGWSHFKLYSFGPCKNL